MKLPVILSQYLYQHKKIGLPGLGIFTLDPSAVIPEPSDRGNQAPASGISFKEVTIHEPEDHLIIFIKEYSGKMKSLASADLDFFLTTGKQLLNIGKPLYLEGIGTLSKNNQGGLVFTPGEYMPVRLEEASKDIRKPADTNFEEPPREYEPASNNNGRQIMLLLLIVIALGALGYGGYYLYKKNNYIDPNNEPHAAVHEETSETHVQDTAKSQQPTTISKPSDTLAAANTQTLPAVSPKPADSSKPVAVAPAASSFVPAPGPDQSLFRFVILETDRKGKALRRYNQLLGYQLNIKMEQKDSAYFKLYFPIAATPRDTLHIKDSLADVYAAQVTIEH